MSRAWRDLPLWLLWAGPLALLDLDRNQLGGSAVGALAACALPGAAGVCILVRAGAARRPLALVLVTAGLAAAIVGVGGSPRLPPAALRAACEAVALLEFGVLLVHAWTTAGPRIAALWFGAGAVYGAILENGGILLGFFSEEAYWVTVPGLRAPLATALGWCVVLYSMRWGARALAPEAGPVRAALLLTALALVYDLQLDPVATAAGLWSWSGDLPTGVRGVPLVNFLAWCAAILPFAWAALRAEHLPGSPAARLLRQMPALLVAALALVLALIAVLEAPWGWPSLGRFSSAAGRLLG